MSRELLSIERCIWCGANISIPSDATSVQCGHCHTYMSVSRFAQQEKRLIEDIQKLRKQLGGQYEALDAKITAMQNEWLSSRDGQLLELFRQGESYQSMGDFSNAIARYEVLLIKALNPEAEVHWRILLCRYGVEYRKCADGSFMPLVTSFGKEHIQRQLNRQHMLFSSAQPISDLLLQDENYRCALRYAPDEQVLSFYQNEILRIASSLSTPTPVSVSQTPPVVSVSQVPPAVSQSDRAEADRLYRHIREMLQSNRGNQHFSLYDWIPDAERIWNKNKDERFGALLLGYYVAVLKNRPLAAECYEQLRRLNTPSANKAISSPAIRAFLGI